MTDDDTLDVPRAIARSTFVDIASRHGVDARVAEAMWVELADTPAALEESTRPSAADGPAGEEATQLSRAVRVLLALGAVLVVASSVWWATELEGNDAGLLGLFALYGLAFLATALYARSRGLEQLAAVSATIAAFYVPAAAAAALHLAGFGFDFDDDDVLAFHQWYDAGWVWLELVALGGATALYVLFRAPLLMLPISAFGALFLLDAAARIVGLEVGDEPDQRSAGVLLLALALGAGGTGAVLDYRGLRRHGLWPHVVAAIALFYAVLLLLGEENWDIALIACGTAFLAMGVWLGRIGYLTAGGLSLWVGITALAPSPIVVATSGLAAVAFGIWLALAQSPLRRWLDSRSLPAPQCD